MTGSATGTGTTGTAAAGRQLRPNVLALPSPTTSRFLLLVVALLSAGAIVGNWIHNEVAGDGWVEQVLQCEQEATAQVAQTSGDQALIEQNALSQRCRASAERLRVAYLAGGVAVAGIGGLAVLVSVPQVIERRRRLEPMDDTLPAARRLAELVSEMGLTTTVTPMVGPLTQVRDAISYGLPGRYRSAFPRAMTIQPASVFDPVARHELAHIAHHDVLYAWLARAMSIALVPLLALPVLVGVVAGSRSVLPDYAWRAALLLLVAELISRALLRSREHDADLRAALVPGGPEAVTAVLARTRDIATAWWQRGVLANHPTRQERAAAVRSPARVAGVTALDGFTAAFLAAVTVPTINSVLATLLGTVGPPTSHG